MAEMLWSQDVFSKGELSPLMYTRVSVEAFYRGLKTASNVISLPQGGVAKRFGTKYINEISGITNANEIYFKSFQYLNECVYLIVIRPLFVDVYLEGILIASVASPIAANDIRSIDHTVLNNVFRVTTGIRSPYDLRRTSNAANVISGFTATTLTLTTPATAGLILPARFTAAVLPTTTPQILANRTYFVKFLTTTSVEIYNSATDAAAGENRFAVGSAGTSANLLTLNSWSFSATSFSVRPVFDFDGGYDSITFTPAAATGFGIAVNLSAPLTAPAALDSKYIGGIFSVGSAVGRIVNVTGPTQFTMNIITPFQTVAYPGTECLLAEPAWSDLRGWPRKCSSFQNRAFFANTDLLPNGLWGSVVNVFNNFDEFTGDATAAISWFPTSDTVNYIQFIVPYRSLTIHTNSGVFSTPLSVETAITQQNFSLSLQDSTPAENVQPTGIDNQIIVISGNDVHSMLWDGLNNAYNANIISIANEQLIRTPVDEASFVDLERAGSRYIFIVNADGTLVIYQTLISESVSGFTPAFLTQSYGNAYFRWVTSNFDGRAWFVTERELANAATPVAIASVASDQLTATGINLSTTRPTAIQFTTSGTLPVSSPQIAIGTWYWALGLNANTIKVYSSQEDALADENAFVFTNAGTSSNVAPYPLTTRFFIEEISNEITTDCAGLYNGAATATISGQTRFNAQDIIMRGDGFAFDDTPINGNVYFEAHGQEREIEEAEYGFPINVVIEPMPLAIPVGGSYKGTNLLEPKHVRSVSLVFADTIEGEVNGQPISPRNLTNTQPGNPPAPFTGQFKVSLMKGWNQFIDPMYTITHSAPFDFKFTGAFYKVEV